MERRYQGRWNSNIMADYCWCVQRDNCDHNYTRASRKRRLLPQNLNLSNYLRDISRIVNLGGVNLKLGCLELICMHFVCILLSRYQILGVSTSNWGVLGGVKISLKQLLLLLLSWLEDRLVSWLNKKYYALSVLQNFLFSLMFDFNTFN